MKEINSGGENPTLAHVALPRVIDYAIPAVAVTLFFLIINNFLPNLFRPLSLSLRTGLNVAVVLIFAFLYVTYRIRGRIGYLLSLSCTLAVFALGLAGLWAIGQTQSTILSGIVPLFDAGNYYTDALRLLSGQDFGIVSSRRPLFPGLLAAVLWVTRHNLMATLGLFTLISAAASYIAVKQIQRTHGAEVAVLVLFVLFLFYRLHSGAVMTENLGFPLGTLGFALLWRGSADRNRNLIALGLLVFTLALIARAGTFFVLPALLVWGSLQLREPGSRFSRRILVLGTVAILAGFAVNFTLIRLLAAPSGVPFANFSYSLFGLASGGKSWNYVFETQPYINTLEEPYQSREIYRLAFELIRKDPSMFVKGILFNWSMLFSDSWYSAYSYVGGENDNVQDVMQWGLFLLCALGFVKWFRSPKDPLTSLVAVAAIGVLLSVPYLPPTDANRMRPYAASIIIFGLLPGMGLSLLIGSLNIRFLDKPDPKGPNPISAVVTSVALIAAILIGPVLIKSFGTIPQFGRTECGGNLSLVSVRFDPGTHVNILRQNEPGLDWIPNVHLSRFRRNSHSLPDTAMIQWATAIEPRNSIFASLNINTMQGVLIVTPTNILPQPHSLWNVCGEWGNGASIGGFSVFYVHEEALISN